MAFKDTGGIELDDPIINHSYALSHITETENGDIPPPV